MFPNRSLDASRGNGNGWMKFHQCAKNGSNNIIKLLADTGTNTHLTTNGGENCLHIAARYGHFSLCKALIDQHNFDVNVADNRGLTALHYSVENGKYKLVKFFADRVNDFHIKTKYGRNCLHIAALNGNLKLCKILINNHNFDAHTADKDEFTALHCSAQNGSYELFDFFTDMRAAIHLKTNDGKNCLHIAAFYGHLRLCKTFLKKHEFDVHMADDEGFKAIHFSAQSSSYQFVTFFLNEGTDILNKTKTGMNCLPTAATNGHLNLCKTLVNNHNFDVNITDNLGFTTLHRSAQNGSYELIKFFVDEGTDIFL